MTTRIPTANLKGDKGDKGDPGAKGDPGMDGSNVLPTDEAIAQAITTPGSDTAGALGAVIARSEFSATTFPAGRKVLYIGESTPTGAGSTSNSQYGIQAVLPQFAGTARVARYGDSINGARDGRKVSEVLSELPGQISTHPDIGLIVCNVGTNDGSAATPVAAFATAYSSIIETAKRAGIPIIATTATPRSADWANQATWTPRYNAWLTDYCVRKGVPLADWHGALVDPASGYIRSSLSAADGVHPNNAGHVELARATAKVIERLSPLPAWLPAYGPQSNGLLANPLMVGGTHSTLPTGWFINPGSPPAGTAWGTEPASEGDGLPAGNWFFLEVDNTAGSAGAFCETRSGYITAGVSPGDTVRVYAHLKADPASQYQKIGFRIRSGTTVLAIPWYRLVTPTPGPIVMDYTIGATVANLNVGLEVTADAGQRARAAIGAVQVYNLTTGGIVDLP